MASRWRVWDLEFKDTLPNISNQIYQEPIRIEQSQTYPSHYLPDCLIELVVSEANRRCVLECESESSVGYKNEYDTDVKSQVLVVCLFVCLFVCLVVCLVVC